MSAHVLDSNIWLKHVTVILCQQKKGGSVHKEREVLKPCPIFQHCSSASPLWGFLSETGEGGVWGKKKENFGSAWRTVWIPLWDQRLRTQRAAVLLLLRENNGATKMWISFKKQNREKSTKTLIHVHFYLMTTVFLHPGFHIDAALTSFLQARSTYMQYVDLHVVLGSRIC